MRRLPPTLTIAGSDPSGGAGIQADLKTFHQHLTYGMSVVTLLTVQNTKGVEAVQVLDPNFVLQQLKAVLSDIPPRATKTGALGSAEVVDAISLRAEKLDGPLIVDPVMISKHGHALLDKDAAEVLRKQLLPFAYLVTPNIPEAEMLSEREIKDVASMERAAQSIAKLGPKNVLIKGGHLEHEATDVLVIEREPHRFPASRIESMNTHGTGCVLSAAITSQLAHGQNLLEAVKRAKAFITEAIRTAPEHIGSGVGPVNMHAIIR